MIEHKELVYLLNRRAQLKAENERMKLLEARYTPLFWVVMCVIVVVVLWRMI